MVIPTAKAEVRSPAAGPRPPAVGAGTPGSRAMFGMRPDKTNEYVGRVLVVEGFSETPHRL